MTLTQSEIRAQAPSARALVGEHQQEVIECMSTALANEGFDPRAPGAQKVAQLFVKSVALGACLAMAKAEREKGQ